jgi:hypothetical protein
MVLHLQSPLVLVAQAEILQQVSAQRELLLYFQQLQVQAEAQDRLGSEAVTEVLAAVQVVQVLVAQVVREQQIKASLVEQLLMAFPVLQTAVVAAQEL